MNQTAKLTIVPPALTKKMKVPAKDKEGVLLTAESLSIVDQTRIATQKDNIGATLGGFALGGIVPFMSYMEAHNDITEILSDPKSLLVLGGLIFSFFTVFKWGQNAFSSKLKALGFVVLIEGTMVFSKITWLSIIALVFLVVINGTATGVNLALASQRARKRMSA
jgi:hypothetical protein